MWSMVQPSSDVDSSLVQAPSSRSKHAVVAVQEGFIYLLGGRAGNMPLKDLWRFDPVQSQWEEVRCRGNRPPSLQEHTMVSWKKKIYVFGGEVGFASTGETPLWILDTSNHTWRKPSARGISTQQPTGRRGHTAVVYNASMHLFGGYQDLRGSSSEIWSFDFPTEQWSLKLLPNHVDQPTPRHNHTSVVHDCAMWVYGGMTDLQERGDFWKWDFTSNVWSRVKSQKGPGELHSHTAVKALSYMYLFGGERGGIWLNDLWRFHFATETWEKVQTEGVIPNPRCRHAALANPLLQDSEGRIRMWDENVEPSLHGTKPSTDSNPPKSISMCFGQTDCSDGGRRPFKFRVHPVRLCSKNTASDDEDEEDYIASYNHHQTQVNLSRSLKEKLSSSRLVRSISSGSYSILHHDNRRDELERLVEETPPSQHRLHSIQKSLSSDAVLESDSESSTPRHTPSASTSHPSSATTTQSSSSGSEVQQRTVRSAYDGPLTTVRDVEEDTFLETHLPGVVRPYRCRHGIRRDEEDEVVLIDFDDGYRSKVGGSCSLTPSAESCCGLPHSASHSSGYHSLADDDPHRDFAGCLNSAGSHRLSLRSRDGVELKTFTPTHGSSRPFEELQNVKKERARSWDRVSKRREVKSYPCSATDDQHLEMPAAPPQPAGMWVRSPSKMRIEQHQWQLCMYMCGGRELGAPEVCRQPIAMWKLYI